MIEIIELGPHARMLLIGSMRILFSYNDPVAFLANAESSWVYVPDEGLTKATQRHLEIHVPTGGHVAHDRADFVRRLELALRMIRL